MKNIDLNLKKVIDNQKAKIVERFKRGVDSVDSRGSLANSLEMKTKGRDSIELAYDEYGNYIDSGRDKGKIPPPSVIENWIQQKGITPQTTIKQASFAIAKSIGQNGIEPRPWIDTTFSDIMDIMANEIQPQIVEIYMDEVEESFMKMPNTKRIK